MPKKSLLSAALTLTLAVSLAAPHSTRGASAGGFEYTVSGSSATVTGCTSTCAAVLDIPATLDGYSVTTIGNSAFTYSALTSVTIPNTVTSIGNFAFRQTTITSVTIPNSVTSIGFAAFMENSLTTVSLGNSVTSVGNNAFKNNALTSITIPNSVTSIGAGAFGSNALTSLTIPNSVTSIGSGAFSYNALTTVTIPSSVTSIGNTAFESNLLTSVIFLGNAPTAGTNVFLSNGGLAYVTRATSATGWSSMWGDSSVRISRTGDFTARANGSADGATVTYTAGATVTLDSTGLTGGGSVTYAETDADCSISGSTLTIVQVGDGSCVVTATIAANGDYLEATDTVTITINRADERATATVKPTASGTAQVNKTLTATGTWTGYPTPTFTYQWYACTSTVSAARSTVPATCKKITGATRSTFKLTSAQRGKYVAVLVKGTSLRTATTSWLSKTTAKVR